MEGGLIVGHDVVASRDLAQAGDVVGKDMTLGGLCRQSMVSGIVRLLKYNPTAQPKRRTGYLRCRAAVGWRRTLGDGVDEVGFHSLVASAARGRRIVTRSFPVLSPVAVLVGIAAMIYGVVAGVMVVFNRDNDGPPD